MGPWLRQNDTNCCTNAEVTRGPIGRWPPRVVQFPYKSQYSRPWMAQNHAFPLENVHLGYMVPPWGHSGGPNPSVALTIFTNAWHKAMLFLWKTCTWGTWPPPWGHSGGPNPSVILTIFTNAWHKAMLFLWKTYTWATWPPHGAILVVQIPR